MSTPRAIQIEKVSHTYERWGNRVEALADVDLAVDAGEWTMVFGPNGSGKSTLLKLLAGRLAAESGRILLLGRDVAGLDARVLSETVYLVHQDPTAGTAPLLTVGEHLMLAGRAATRAGNDFSDLLTSAGLDVSPDQPVNTLSGGQRQVLTLLLAKLRPSPIVLLDEPFTALDATRANLCKNIIETLHQHGKTLVLVTHDLEYARAHGQRLIKLHNGKLVEDERIAVRPANRCGPADMTTSRLPG